MNAPRTFPVPMGVQLAEARSPESRVNELVDTMTASTPAPVREAAIMRDEAARAERMAGERDRIAPMHSYTDPNTTVGEILADVAAFKALGFRYSPAWVRDERGDPIGFHLIGAVR